MIINVYKLLYFHIYTFIVWRRRRMDCLWDIRVSARNYWPVPTNPHSFLFYQRFPKNEKIYSVSPPLNRTKEIEEELTLLEGGKQRKPTLMIFISIMAFIGNPARSPMNNQNGPHILISPFAQISQTCFHNFPPSLL